VGLRGAVPIFPAIISHSFIHTQKGIHKANDISLDDDVTATGEEFRHSHGPWTIVRRENTAKDLDGFDRCGIGPQWIEVLNDVVDARPRVAQYIEEIVGVFILTAQA
jgi:hypothetical protein